MSWFKSWPFLARVEGGHWPVSRLISVSSSIVVLLLTSSCSSETSSEVARSRLHDTLRQLAIETNTYNKHTADEFPGDPNQYLKDAALDLAALRASADDWKSAAAKAQLGPSPQDGWPSNTEVTSFAIAFDNWIAAQEEQVDGIHACMPTLDLTTCVLSAASQNSGRWLNAHSQLTDAYQSMTNDPKMGAVAASPSS